jgi:hypothetical protein
MATYKLIIKRIINTENNILSFNYDKTDNVSGLYKSFFILLLKENITIKNKFLFFYETLNNFLLKDKQDQFIEYFYRIQKTYKVLNKFSFIYKYKKSKLVVNTDMTLNTITENQNNVLCIFHNNARYLFSIHDLINIINTSLTNHCQFFAEPLCIKNPYNNLPFLKSTLYNIYLFIKCNTNYSPILFFNFFSCDFNLTIFTNKYDYTLREYAIENYVNKSPSNIILKEIKTMLTDFNKNCKTTMIKNKIIIDNDFPSYKLIQVMRPYLLLFITAKYSLLSYKRIDSANFLRYLLLRFNSYNPQFGRKKYKIVIKYNNNFEKK